MGTLGERVRQTREATGMNQSEFARACGIRPASLNQIESGVTRSLRGSTLARMAQVSGFSPLWIEAEIGPKTATAAGTAEEMHLLSYYRALSSVGRAILLRSAYGLVLTERDGHPATTIPAAPARKGVKYP